MAGYFVVLSGKGGVGKTSVSALLALHLAQKGHRVGIIDADLCHPNVPDLFGAAEKKVSQSSDGWCPVEVECGSAVVKLMSSGFLAEKGVSIVLRGPKKRQLLSQFLFGTKWGDVDFVVIDTPPGTTDEQLAVRDLLKNESRVKTVVVTTSQGVSVADNRRLLSFYGKESVSGIVENMSGCVCPGCGYTENVFSRKGGEHLALELGIPFLGALPLCPDFVSECQDAALCRSPARSTLYKEFAKIAEKLLED
ncbi:MAG: cytosolic Fe-S cluster assembly factor NUBP2/Cfd1 [Amphiamblys sp. WSBS2006]|nr:MAG: cytosolic Fe-S cluster assembly factor NUBP2/Cfd1 [Amphiamblys sp. WSBS2006]